MGAFVDKYCAEIDNYLVLAVRDRQQFLKNKDEIIELPQCDWMQSWRGAYITLDNNVFWFKPVSKRESGVTVKTLEQFLKQDCISHKIFLKDLENKYIMPLEQVAKMQEVDLLELKKILEEAEKEGKPYKKLMIRF